MDNRYVHALMPGVIGQLQKQNRRKLYFNNPVLWAYDHLGVILWEAQADAAMAVVQNKNVVVKAGHEVGKSFLAGVLICWWIDTRWDLPGSCFVVSTASSPRSTRGSATTRRGSSPSASVARSPTRTCCPNSASR